ncbi:glycosyltransferase family 4 protein [Duganella sp. LjRoot269]|uniref:glycosyltransferase family 4 protein n=1 Tax=Duganella sp. LjRoot269 TaxID=3342305 RepID=UPI003ECFFE20
MKNKKLLSINNYHYRRGGSDVVYLEHAALMEELGWDNAFFSMQHPNNLPSDWSRYFVDELEFGHSYSLANKISMAAKAVYSFEAQRKLTRLLADYQPSIAHLHCIYHHLSPSILPTLAKAGVPVVMTAHDLKIACPAYKMLNDEGICERCRDGSVLNVVRHRCVRGSLGASAIVAVESGLQRRMQTYRRYLDKVVVPSRFFMEKFVEWGWPREQFVYIPNYVDASRFAPHYAAGDYFLFFGRLAPEKGVATLLRAAAAAGVRLKIAGTGPIQEQLHALNAELGGAAEFLGYQSGAALHTLIQQARAVVLPSEWYENAPMSVLESCAFGKPVIGADIGGIPEMIEPGQTGWTFPSRDVASLTALLAQVQAMPDSALEQCGRAARAMVEQRFNRDGYVAATLQLYADLGVNA